MSSSSPSLTWGGQEVYYVRLGDTHQEELGPGKYTGCPHPKSPKFHDFYSPFWQNFIWKKKEYIALGFKKSRFPCLSMCLSSRQQFTTAKDRWSSKTRNSPNQPELVDSLRQLIVRSQFLSFLERFNGSIEPWVAPSTDNDSFVPSSWLSIPLSVSVWTLILYVTDPMFIRFSESRTILLREFEEFFYLNLLVYFPGFLGILWYLEIVRGSHCEDEVPALLMDGYAVVVVNFILRYRHLLEMLPVDDDICRQSVTEWCYFE